MITHIQKTIGRSNTFVGGRPMTEVREWRGKGSTMQNSGRDNHSIGLLNEMPSLLGDRSYFRRASDQFQISMEHSSRLEEGYELASPSNKLQRIENELSDIEKMKMVFENRRRENQGHSTDKKMINRSVDKHNLKPSQIPRMVGVTSEFGISRTSDFKEDGDEDRFSFEMGRPKLVGLKEERDLDMANESQEEESSSSYNGEEMRKVSPQCHLGGSFGAKSHKPCDCSALVQDFMSQIRKKMSGLAHRVTEIEQRNASLRNKHEKVMGSNLKSIAHIQRLQEQRRQLIQTQQKWGGDKVELQSLLKQVLFKKEREKVQKQNMSLDCQNYFKCKERTNRENSSANKDRKPLQPRIQSGKNKVQNLLQRLQLRVERS